MQHDDIDVAGISDHFTISVITELEDAGFCAKGEGGAFVADGALAIGGRLPTNTHGGYLSGTHAASCALFTLIELVVQLRGDAGPRQVSGAELAFRVRRRRCVAGALRRRAGTRVMEMERRRGRRPGRRSGIDQW